MGRQDVGVSVIVNVVQTIEARLVNRPQTILASLTVSAVLVGAVLCITGLICTKGEAVPR